MFNVEYTSMHFHHKVPGCKLLTRMLDGDFIVTTSIHSFVHDPLTTTSNEETLLPDFREFLKHS